MDREGDGRGFAAALENPLPSISPAFDSVVAVNALQQGCFPEFATAKSLPHYLMYIKCKIIFYFAVQKRCKNYSRAYCSVDVVLEMSTLF